MAGPAFDGADQLTLRLVADAADTFGASGLPGASVFTSVTVTVIVCVAVFSRSPAPLVAVTTTTYWLLPAALAGSTLSMSLASSKFGAASNVSAPDVAPIEKNIWSAPPVIA